MKGSALNTAGEVIDALGGATAMTKLTGRKLAAVSNWRTNNRLPSETFLVISNALNERGQFAPPSLWRISQPEKQGAE